jgi:hypothetical protein
MKKYHLAALALAAVFLLLPLLAFAKTVDGRLAKFVPKGCKVIEVVKGDLNKDSLDDYVLIVEETDSVINATGIMGLDSNRRGIVIVFDKGGTYELAAEVRGCFASRDFVDGIYYGSASHTVSIKRGNLYIANEEESCNRGINHHTFRYQNSNFELIGFDEQWCRSGRGFYGSTSINFLTNKIKKTEAVFYGVEDEDGKTCDKEDNCEKVTWENFKALTKPITLRMVFGTGDDRLCCNLESYVRHPEYRK